MKKKIVFFIILAMFIGNVNPTYASEGEQGAESETATKKETIGSNMGDDGNDKFSSSFGVKVTYIGNGNSGEGEAPKPAPKPEPEVINVDLSWGDMLFDYVVDSDSTWNSKTHKYDVKKSAKWKVRNDNGNLIKITNYSKVDINASLGWLKAESMSALNGGFYSKNNSLEQEDKVPDILNIQSIKELSEEEKENAIRKVYFNLSGLIDERLTDDVSLGEVTVVIK